MIILVASYFVNTRYQTIGPKIFKISFGKVGTLHAEQDLAVR